MLIPIIFAEAAIAFCILGFEVVSARLFASHVGMSTDTWTAIIASFLMSVAIGNHWGGEFAASRKDAERLALATRAVAAGGVAIMLSMLVLPIWDETVLAADPSSFWRKIVFVMVPCVPAGMCFGIAAPLLMMAALSGHEHNAARAGAVYAAGAFGSVLGVMSALWWMLDLVGVRLSLMMIGGLALLTAAGIGWLAMSIRKQPCFA